MEESELYNTIKIQNGTKSLYTKIILTGLPLAPIDVTLVNIDKHFLKLTMEYN